MATREELLEELRREVEYLDRHTQRQYFNRVQDYLDYVGARDWRDRDVLYKYTQRLRKRYSTETVNYIVRSPIGALFRAHGLRIPIKLPKPKVEESVIDLINRVQFTVDELAAIVRSAKAGPPPEQALFAIATVYGTRVGELQRVLKKDVNPKLKTIVIRTEKGGRMWQHTVPEPIQASLFGYKYPAISLAGLYDLFGDVVGRAGIARQERKSFHAIRHGLFAAMIHEWDIPQEVAFSFMRWKMPGMVGVYAPFGPKTDEKVFAKHGLLPVWGEA